MTLRTISVTLADGQRLIIDYDTEVEGADNAALDTEVRAAMVESPMYTLQTRPDGTTATFLSAVQTISFLNPNEE